MKRTRQAIAGTLMLLAWLAGASVATAASATGEREPLLADDGAAPPGTVPALFRGELELPDTLGVGRVAGDVAEHLPAVDALARHLSSRLSAFGYSRALPVVARDNEEMVEFLRRGIVDLVSETPMSALHFVKAAGASIILRERRAGRREYSSVIVVLADSPVRGLRDLGGRRVAFGGRGSTASFLLPLADLKRAGIPAAESLDPATDVSEKGINYFFAQSESSVLTAVWRRVADAGALSDDEWRRLELRDPDKAATLRVVHESGRIPRAFVLTAPGVTAAQREGLRDALLLMATDPAGSAALDRYDHVDGFDAIDGEIAREIHDLDGAYALIRDEVH